MNRDDDDDDSGGGSGYGRKGFLSFCLVSFVVAICHVVLFV